eukprot:TRINITY_DN15952_c0_g1_i1.p3 TRINITY_DN15952_c0_g1~~TRINITY_DN15952_c0_g1_i1.p3  ORF type:complete len:142 (-),score=13.06 TRINITY_DN15952_c0_g1_i1:120-545(-)
MGTVDLIPTYKYHDIFTAHEVMVDLNSINRYCLDENQYIVGFDYQERRHNKLQTRYTTILPKLPLFPHLIILMFAPDIRIVSDELENGQNQRYEKLINDDNEFPFDYFLTKQSLDEINGIRNQLRKLLSSEGFYLGPSDEI